MGRGIGNVLGAVAPIAAGYYTGGLGSGFMGFGAGTASAIAGGALAGAGIAGLSGQDMLSGAVMGGLGGYGGGNLATAAEQAAATAASGMTTAATNQAVMGQQLTNQAAYAGAGGSMGGMAAQPAALQGAGGSYFSQGAGFAPQLAKAQSVGTSMMSNPTALGTTRAASSIPTPKFGTDYGMSDIAKNLGEGSTAMGYGKMGLSGLGALSSMPEDTQSFESVKDKYDPNSRLNLSMDTGINEALRKDSGLRLYNQGGLMALAGGGYLETGGTVGDGMSDEIKATIDGEQEARLSDGEFVLPADIVSHLGNGSSDAGAKQLYSMMDRLRQARTGTEKQGKEINAGRYMPA
tara:strand:+ start:58 stop:1104 length:1047 start_codon:yes stop_codon:yes gene_type:complete